MFGITESPEQFKKFMKKHFELNETLTKCLKCFWICPKIGKRYLQLLEMQSEVAPSSGSNQQFNCFS